MTTKFYNILYKGRKIYSNLSIEECTEVLQDFSENFYEEKSFDPIDIELEEI
jgi:hypothetical protein